MAEEEAAGTSRLRSALVTLQYPAVRVGTLVVMFLGSLGLAHSLGSEDYGVYAQALAFAGLMNGVALFGQVELYLRDELSFRKLFHRTLGITALTAVVATSLGTVVLGAGAWPLLAALCVASVLSFVMSTYWAALQHGLQNSRRAGSELLFRVGNQVASNLGALVWRTPLTAALAACLVSAVPLARRPWRRVRGATAPLDRPDRPLRAGTPYAIPALLGTMTYVLLPLVFAAAASPSANAGFRFIALAATGSLTATRALTVEQLQRPLFAAPASQRRRIVRDRLSSSLPMAAVMTGGLIGGAVFLDPILPAGVPSLRAALFTMAVLPVLQVVTQALDTLAQTFRRHLLNNAKQVIVTSTAVATLALLGVTVEAGAIALVVSEVLGLLVYLGAALARRFDDPRSGRSAAPAVGDLPR